MFLNLYLPSPCPETGSIIPALFSFAIIIPAAVKDHQMAILFREFSSSSGIILEHIIHSSLQRYSKLNSGKGYETDFILSDEDSVPHYLIQVTDDWSVSREREIRGIAAAIEETGLANGLIITMDNEEIIETEKMGNTGHLCLEVCIECS